VAVDQIIGFHGVTALERQNLWGRVAQRSSLGGAREAQEGLERSSGSRSLSRYNDLVCGLGARRSRVAKIATSRSSAEIFELVHADFTAVTLNRPVAVDQIIGFHGVTALERQNLWGRVAQRSSLGGA
ncbi:hypothetical protein D9B85_14180, partial [Corynebacterium diphtheriae]